MAPRVKGRRTKVHGEIGVKKDRVCYTRQKALKGGGKPLPACRTGHYFKLLPS